MGAPPGSERCDVELRDPVRFDDEPVGVWGVIPRRAEVSSGSACWTRLTDAGGASGFGLPVPDGLLGAGDPGCFAAAKAASACARSRFAWTTGRRAIPRRCEENGPRDLDHGPALRVEQDREPAPGGSGRRVEEALLAVRRRSMWLRRLSGVRQGG